MFFDLSLPDIVVLLGLGVVLFGPDKLPKAAADAARIIQRVRSFGESARGELRGQLGPEFEGLDLADLHPKAFIRRNLLDEGTQLRALRDEINHDLRAPLGPSAPSGQGDGVVPLAAGERPLFDAEAT